MKKPEPAADAAPKADDEFVEGIDYYFENGLMVLTAEFLRRRGYCCQNDCRNCPYRPRSRSNV